MAEVILRQRLVNQAATFRVASCGTTAIHAGKPMDPRACTALRDAGYAPGAHVARQIEDADFLSHQWIIALDPPILRTLQGWTPPGFAGRLDLLTRFARQSHGAGIADPFSAGPEAFVDSLREIDAAVRGLERVLLLTA